MRLFSFPFTLHCLVSPHSNLREWNFYFSPNMKAFVTTHVHKHTYSYVSRHAVGLLAWHYRLCWQFKVIIIIYIYHALINALSAHIIHINLNTIFYTHIEHGKQLHKEEKKSPKVWGRCLKLGESWLYALFEFSWLRQQVCAGEQTCQCCLCSPFCQWCWSSHWAPEPHQ